MEELEKLYADLDHIFKKHGLDIVTYKLIKKDSIMEFENQKVDFYDLTIKFKEYTKD